METESDSTLLVWYLSTYMLGIPGMLLNVLALVVACRTYQRSHTKYLLNGLAASQALAAATSVLFVSLHMAEVRSCVVAVCRVCCINGFLLGFLLTVLAMALDAFGLVHHPILHKKRVYRRHAVLTLGLVWLTAALVGGLLGWVATSSVNMSRWEDFTSRANGSIWWCSAGDSSTEHRAANALVFQLRSYLLTMLVLGCVALLALIVLLSLTVCEARGLQKHAAEICRQTHKTSSLLGRKASEASQKTAAFALIGLCTALPWLISLALGVVMAPLVEAGESLADYQLAVYLLYALVLLAVCLSPLFTRALVPEIAAAYRRLLPRCCGTPLASDDLSQFSGASVPAIPALYSPTSPEYSNGTRDSHVGLVRPSLPIEESAVDNLAIEHL